MSRRALRAQANRRSIEPTDDQTSSTLDRVAVVRPRSAAHAAPVVLPDPAPSDAAQPDVVVTRVEPVYLSRRERRQAETRAAAAETALPDVPADMPTLTEPAPTEPGPTELAPVAEPSASDTLAADVPAVEAPAVAPAASTEGPRRRAHERRVADVTGPIRLAPDTSTPLCVTAAPSKAERRRIRRQRIALTAILSSFGLACSLVIAGPAQADPHQVAGTAASGQVQTLRVSDTAQGSTVQKVDYSASAMVSMVSASGDEYAHDSASAVADALDYGGIRATIVRTALGYFGDPYVLGGASHSGIDCSGLTMRAYQAVGIELPHYVPTQDARGRVITQAQAQPGDLVVFNDEEHIGIYLGDGMVLHAPETGRSVSIEPVSIWEPMGIHFTTLLH